MEALISWWITLTTSLLLFIVALINLSRRQRRLQKLVSGDEGTASSYSVPLSETALKPFEQIPSPRKFPFLGHLHLLHGDPFVKMTELSAKYGDIYFLQLGTVKTVVVSSLNLMKEILVSKGSQFGHRADFLRYHVLFGGDKENSLAFCNWSQTQKLRRALARRFCHTKMFGHRVDEAVSRGSDALIEAIEKNLMTGTVQDKLKQNVNEACANIFFEFFSSQYFDGSNDEEFKRIVRYFDDIFWDINQNHPTDVLPFLAPLYRGYFKNMCSMSHYIRSFVLKRVIPHHMKRLDAENPEDLVDNLLLHLQETKSEVDENKLTMEQVLFELEDFIGGHSAVANLVARALVEIAAVDGMSEKIYNECVKKENSAYMQAILYETLRKTSSPIVPHVASEDTAIAGYRIKEGTMVIFNNYELNTSTEYWESPEHFKPERFLTECGAFRKPSYFLPFSTGKRACMGYKLVEEVFEGIIKAIITRFNLEVLGKPNILPLSCVALHPEIKLNIQFSPRLS